MDDSKPWDEKWQVSPLPSICVIACVGFQVDISGWNQIQIPLGLVESKIDLKNSLGYIADSVLQSSYDMFNKNLGHQDLLSTNGKV